MTVLNLHGQPAKTPDEAVKEATRTEWRDVIIFGRREYGEFHCIASHMTNFEASFMVDILKHHVMQPIIKEKL